MTDSEIQEYIGVPRRKVEKEVKNTKYQQQVIDLDGPVQHEPELELHRRFYDQNVKLERQTFHAHECFFIYDSGDVCGWKDHDAYKMRIHHMQHYNKDDFEKFNCQICEMNFDTYRGLQRHTCRSRSDYTAITVFRAAALAEIKDVQPYGVPECRKCGRKADKYDEKFADHLTNCYRFSYDCKKCGILYATYQQARNHYEKCNGTKPKNHPELHFTNENIQMPDDADKLKKWTDEEMLQHMKDYAVPKLNRLLDIHLPSALITIGQTQNVKKRFNSYSCAWQVFKNTESCNRFVEVEEYIVFKCWSRADALQYEYLLQTNMQGTDGIFVDYFKDRCNNQLIQKPRRNKEQLEPKASYVNARLTRCQFVWRDKREKPPKDMDEPPAKMMKLLSPPHAVSSQTAGPSTAGPSTAGPSSAVPSSAVPSTAGPSSACIILSSSESESEVAAPYNEVVIPESDSDCSMMSGFSNLNDAGPSNAAHNARRSNFFDNTSVTIIREAAARRKNTEDPLSQELKQEHACELVSCDVENVNQMEVMMIIRKIFTNAARNGR